MGTWDATYDFLYLHGSSSDAFTTEGRLTGSAPGLLPETNPPSGFQRHRTARGRSERVPLHVELAGVGAIAALIVASLPVPIVTALTAMGTAILAYVIAIRHAGSR